MEDRSKLIHRSFLAASLQLHFKSVPLSSWVILHNTSYLRHVMLSYVVYKIIVVYIILYCNDDWRVEDGVVHCSRQQSLVAKWLGLCVYS